MKLKFYVNDDVKRASDWEEAYVEYSSFDYVDPNELKGLCRQLALLKGYGVRCSISDISLTKQGQNKDKCNSEILKDGDTPYEVDEDTMIKMCAMQMGMDDAKVRKLITG
jgi:hypothetical protein